MRAFGRALKSASQTLLSAVDVYQAVYACLEEVIADRSVCGADFIALPNALTSVARYEEVEESLTPRQPGTGDLNSCTPSAV